MITEQDIRQIYEGFYKIAELSEDSKYTHNLAMQLHGMLTDVDNLPEKAVTNLINLTLKIDFEYYTRLENLADRQRTLEAKAK